MRRLVLGAGLLAATGIIFAVAVHRSKSTQSYSATQVAYERCEVGTQKVSSDFRLALSRTDLTYPYSTSIHDFDGDGRLDVIATNPDQRSIHIMLNKGGLVFDEKIIQLPQFELIEAHIWVDIQGNGIKRLVFVNNDPGSIHWLDEKGTVHNITERGAFPRVYALASADFDGDGRIDLAAINFWGGEFRIYWNRDSDHWPHQVVDFPGGDTRGIAVADMDGDGRPDIVIASRSSGTIYWYRNAELGWEKRLIADGLRFPSKLVVKDMNNDGKMDVIVAAGFDPRNDLNLGQRCRGGIVWFENDEKGISWTKHNIWTTLLGAANVAVKGNMVAAVSYNRFGRLAYYLPVGDLRTNLWRQYILNDDFRYGTSVHIVDLDGDGIDEIVASGVRGQASKTGILEIWTRDNPK